MFDTHCKDGGVIAFLAVVRVRNRVNVSATIGFEKGTTFQSILPDQVGQLCQVSVAHPPNLCCG